MSTSLATNSYADPSRIQALEDRIKELEQRLSTLEERAPEDRVSIIVFSGDLDRVLASFVIATGAAAMGQNGPFRLLVPIERFKAAIDWSKLPASHAKQQ